MMHIASHRYAPQLPFTPSTLHTPGNTPPQQLSPTVRYILPRELELCLECLRFGKNSSKTGVGTQGITASNQIIVYTAGFAMQFSVCNVD